MKVEAKERVMVGQGWKITFYTWIVGGTVWLGSLYGLMLLG